VDGEGYQMKMCQTYHLYGGGCDTLYPDIYIYIYIYKRNKRLNLIKSF